MSMTAAPLAQARAALIEAGQQRLALIAQLTEQRQKISDLEAEVQIQADAAARATQALADARTEIEALRAQMPDAATVRAYHALTEVLTAPSVEKYGLRIAA
jgi:septal ring factor EnvC (AmiA/AmiB activator)